MAALPNLTSMASPSTSGFAGDSVNPASASASACLLCGCSLAAAGCPAGGQAHACKHVHPAPQCASTMRHPLPPPTSPSQRCPPQSYGRGQERNASCPTYISANAGCGYSWPTLARAPSLDTKWIFDPAPGGIFKWYIRMSVSKGRPLGCIAAVLAAAAAAAPLLPRPLPLDGRTFPGAR